MSEPGLLLVCGTDAAGRGAVADRLRADRSGEVLELSRPSTQPEQLLAAGIRARVAVVVVDIVDGLDAEARRLTHLVALLGVRPVVLVATRLDAHSGQAAERLAELREEWDELAARIGLPDATCVALTELSDHLADQPAAAGDPHAANTEHADQIQATIVWGDEEPLLRGRSYGLRIGEREVNATVAPIKYRINLDTFVQSAATKLEAGEIGVAALELSEPIDFSPYTEDPGAGSFVLTDPLTEATVGIGLIQFGLRRAHNVRWQSLHIDRTAREAALRQRPRVIWLTGLSGAGKSTIANLVESELHRRGRHTYLLDGDNVRHGLNRDLGFTDADRVENVRRVAEVAKLMLDAGLIVLVSFISPFRSERQMARSLFATGEFIEVHVDTPLAVAEDRDPKGLYAKARAGELRNFTGIDSPYEPPEDPELRLETTTLSPERAAQAVIELLEGQ